MTISERHRQVWGAIHAFIRNHGGVVTSQPDASPIRFQCSPGSELPKLLQNMRFDLRHVGGTEIIMPVTEMVQQHGRPASQAVARDQAALTSVEVYEFPMPQASHSDGS